ncbi:molybdate ABC transporter substrate-binding protein [Magnetovibrio sp. PR-2]|uniref:molybdate ABC transporter substrate-binding protein n=1 Tax=Magnetovibrio sp. PR-2 TaxID=3120356 RepID=UPI002FCE351F
MRPWRSCLRRSMFNAASINGILSGGRVRQTSAMILLRKTSGTYFGLYCHIISQKAKFSYDSRPGCLSMLKRSHTVFLVYALCLLCSFSSLSAHAEERVTLFAAASTQAAMHTITTSLKEQGIDIIVIYGSSSSLARQVEHGAPADIFLSANTNWTDYLRNINKIEPDQLRIVAKNALVMVSGAAPFPAPRMAVGPGYPLGSILQNSRFAIGDPAHVPAGQYAKEALQNWELWDAVKDRLAPARDATGALMFVARGDARLGIVYASDLKRSERVRPFAQIPPQLHAPIVYPAAIVQGQMRPSVLKVMRYLTSPEGQDAFRAAGFGSVD